MSLTNRAIIALLLMIGFYVLALSVAGGLLWIVYAQMVYLDRVNIRISFLCLAGAGIILWSILPRPDHFEEPGPQISSSEHPKLFAEISKIAQALGQEMPHDVYLAPQVNAWVAQRGGIMGIGSRRVMVLGVPLMGLLTVSQFRAVLAHEFGHYHAGDTKLGPWIYKTRSAIGRTLRELGRRESLLVYLFTWYGNLFLRITLAISRAQEFAADRLAAQFAGTNALVDGLKQIHRGALAWQAYLQTEVGPMFSAGFSPPLTTGFVHFIETPNIQKPLNERLQRELAEGKADPMDSHPALPERITALKEACNSDVQDQRLAAELLEDLKRADAQLFNPEGKLAPVTWEEAVDKLWIPMWKQQAQQHKQALLNMTAADLGDHAFFTKRFQTLDGVWVGLEERVQLAARVAGCALVLALLREGWAICALPGEAYCEKNGEKLEPFELVRKLFEREITAEQWQELCARTGIQSLQLSVEPQTASAATS